MAKVFTFDEVASHRSPESCWVVLYGKVYDVTSFLPNHPGGSKIILKLAGQDATEEYDPIHPPGTLEDSLPVQACLGTIDASTLPKADKSQRPKDETPGDQLPTLEDCLNLDDIEALATKKISRKAWAYYYSASDDLYSKSYNSTVYSSILLRPRIFVDCTHCDTTTTVLGHRVQLPIFVSPAAMARLGNPAGEAGIAAACAKYGVCQMISNNASQRPEEIVANAPADQIFGWQLYVQTERAKSEKMLQRINKLPSIKFIVLTLDAPVPGKREHDEREGRNVGAQLPIPSAAKKASELASASTDSNTGDDFDAEGLGSKSGPVGLALFAGTAVDLTWHTTLPWLARHTSLPIVLKGIQTHEDAYLATMFPQVRGIILSNHGGRAMDTAPPALHTLLEIRKFCPQVFEKVDVFVDGGIRRGTDAVKALCLGAKGVGIGRAALFGLGAGGVQGVERVFGILKGELETAMRLLGVERVDDLGPRHINARRLEREIYDGEPGLASDVLDVLKAKL